MHTFDFKDGHYRVIFETNDNHRTLFKVPSFRDAIAAISVLNGGKGMFNVCSQEHGNITHQITIRSY